MHSPSWAKYGIPPASIETIMSVVEVRAMHLFCCFQRVCQFLKFSHFWYREGQDFMSHCVKPRPTISGEVNPVNVDENFT